MATSIGDSIPKRKMAFFNPLSFIVGMAADLLLTIGFASIAIAFIYIPQLNGTIIRSALGIAMVLFVPGYALVSALFPRIKDPGGLERIILSFGLSIAIVPLIGLISNYTGWGVRLDPIVGCVTVLTVACALVANKRRHDVPKEERFSIDFVGIYRSINYDIFKEKAPFEQALTITTIVSLVLAAVLTAYVVSLPGQDEKYTEFYILGPDGKMDNYPYKYILGDEKTVIVGIANHEHRNMTYDLVMNLNDLNNSTMEPLYRERLTLPEKEVWEKAINVTPALTGINMKMEFLLYADDNMSDPYKECYLWVNVTHPTPKPTYGRPTAVPSRKPPTNPTASVPIEYK